MWDYEVKNGEAETGCLKQLLRKVFDVKVQ